jgi:putative MATE family efflux protein
MVKNQHDIKGLKLSKLAIPLGIQLLLSFCLLLTDAFFLSKISDDAAASVGAIFTLYCIFIVLFNQIGQAGSSVASQYIGAKKFEYVTPTYLTATIVNTAFGIIISILLLFFSNDIGLIVGLSKENAALVSIYIKITGGAFFFYALTSVYNGILSSRGKTLPGMLGSIVSNITNIILNIIFLYGLFGFPKLGIAGIALATVASQVVDMFFLTYIVHIREKIKFSFVELKDKIKILTKNVLKIGLPASIEPVSVQLMSFIITIIILSLGMISMAAKTYTYNITTILISWSVAIGISTQVLVAHAVGSKKFDKANAQLHKSILISTIIIFSMSLIMYLLSENIFRIFTTNTEIIHLGKNLLLICVILEPIRAINITIQYSLFSAGDAKFTSLWGMIIMWIIGLPLLYSFGILMNLGLIGIWIGSLLDEFIRCILYYTRWKQRKWEKTGVVSDTPIENISKEKLETTYEPI